MPGWLWFAKSRHVDVSKGESIIPNFNPAKATTRSARNSRIWLAHDDEHNEWLAEVIVREKHEIRHLVERYSGSRPSWHQVRQDALRRGIHSPRPYQLGQASDGSITTCVMALFKDFCKARRLDAVVLLRKACREKSFSSTDFRRIRRAADWEGTAYPRRWGPAAIDGLLKSLHEINYHTLAEVVGDLGSTRERERRGGAKGARVKRG